MKSHRQTLTLERPERMAFVGTTPQVEAPERYHHDRAGADNGDAHHERWVMGREFVVAVTEGRLDFGPWEQIFHGEFDGRRRKRVLIEIVGE